MYGVAWRGVATAVERTQQRVGSGRDGAGRGRPGYRRTLSQCGAVASAQLHCIARDYTVLVHVSTSLLDHQRRYQKKTNVSALKPGAAQPADAAAAAAAVITRYRSSELS